MLDVGFSEILLTSAIALIVLGPEKLPKVARQVGNWVGRARAMARQLTEQLEREVNAEELIKQTKSTAFGSSPAASDSSPVTSSSAPATFDTSYDVPNGPSAVLAPPAAAPPPGAAPASVHAPGPAYSDATATVHGADWHPSPPDNKSANE